MVRGRTSAFGTQGKGPRLQRACCRVIGHLKICLGKMGEKMPVWTEAWAEGGPSGTGVRKYGGLMGSSRLKGYYGGNGRRHYKVRGSHS